MKPILLITLTAFALASCGTNSDKQNTPNKPMSVGVVGESVRDFNNQTPVVAEPGQSGSSQTITAQEIQ